MTEDANQMSAQSLTNMYNKENSSNEEGGIGGTFAEQNKCKFLSQFIITFLMYLWTLFLLYFHQGLLYRTFKCQFAHPNLNTAIERAMKSAQIKADKKEM